MDTKLVLCYGIEKPHISVRRCLHDWKEGDVINTDGIKTEIYAVFQGTKANLAIMYHMFLNLNTRTSMKWLKMLLDGEEIDDDVNKWEWPDLSDVLDYFKCTKETIKKRIWKDYNKCLDYMEFCVNMVK